MIMNSFNYLGEIPMIQGWILYMRRKIKYNKNKLILIEKIDK